MSKRDRPKKMMKLLLDLFVIRYVLVRLRVLTTQRNYIIDKCRRLLGKEKDDDWRSQYEEVDLLRAARSLDSRVVK